MARVHEECGEIGEFNLAGNRIVMVFGEAAQEAFFRAPDPIDKIRCAGDKIGVCCRNGAVLLLRAAWLTMTL